jgi:UDP:flavonoid glycosyltransferase YjiC (YdhE family)
MIKLGSEEVVRKKRILFVGETVTLAHFARPYVLLSSLPKQDFEIHFAFGEQYKKYIEYGHIETYSLNTISGSSFMDALAHGRPAYDTNTLKRYVEADRELIRLTQPDFVVGDFRLSIHTASQLERVPCAMISNIQWSPSAIIPEFPCPELSFFSWLKPFPLGLTQILFNIGRSGGFNAILSPINEMRQAYALAPYSSLQEAYTAGDFTFYADAPGFFATSQMPLNHSFLGPLLWSPRVAVPDWWSDLERIPQKKIYVTMGSSGSLDVISNLITIIKDFPAQFIFSAAGRINLDGLPKNCFAADFLPGDLAVQVADFVICNGGSSTAHQALASGKPLLGIPSNLDQCLSMQAIQRLGAGLSIRADRATKENLRALLEELIHNASYALKAKEIQKLYQTWNACDHFQQFLTHFFDAKLIAKTS